MWYRTAFPRDALSELERLQRDIQQAFTLSPSIRGLGRGFPALNLGRSGSVTELYAFAPGIDPASLDVQIERGVLTIAGERKAPDLPEKATVHIHERFEGRFRRVVTLPDDIDAGSAEARYQDGVLQIRLTRKAEAEARRIEIH